MQQTIICIWFPNSQLPFAFGILLFLVKIVRTTNDNVASMFYNETNGGLIAYFWVGFALCVFSCICTVLLAQIHESVIESEQAEVKEKQNELKKAEIDTHENTS